VSFAGARAAVVRPLVVLVVALLVGRPASALDTEECLGCHEAQVEATSFAASTHGDLGCAACHADVTGHPHTPAPATPDCAGCHEAAVTAYRQGVHGAARAAGAPEAPACADCHGSPHAVRPSAVVSPMHFSQQARTCARCHADQALEEKFRIPVVRPVEAYLQSAHARAVAEGRRGAVCADCHGAHEVRRGMDPRSTLWRATVPATCGRCHADILAAYRESVHGEGLARGLRGSPVCTDCHGEHSILAPSDPRSPVFAANIPGQTCGRCHGDARLAEKYGLPARPVTAFRESYHGLALRAGQLRVANCASCHGVHDILPATDPRSHVHPANLARTCGTCHPGAGTAFTLGPIHASATSGTARAVAWIRFVYLWLIGGVVGAMVLHNLLDLRGKARRAQPPPRGTAWETPERMSRVLRWQHGLVMVSVPVLVYTGFALTYPESWWAAPLLRWETALGLRGWLHRVTAVVLLAALGWHLVGLVVSRRARACFRGFVPSRGDVVGLVRTLAFHLGRRTAPPPRAKVGYVEKAEYWAFLWGSGLMALTGFVLWFENVALRHLPTWVIDVATALHFYEAVLATLAILVWHGYWVIFDPDVYPMDGSWWHGRAPRAHEEERRAADTTADEARPDRADGE
jgi:cytochrome b subunit of formate dehydrogenase